jgi:sigma-B regulation protein RsbU (phosphoserine phosphatase)
MAKNGILKRIETRVLGLVRLPPPSSRLRRLTFWVGVLALLLVLLALLPGTVGVFFAGLRALVVLIFAVCALIVAIGWMADLVRNKLLWRLSNRLVVTYLLVGFAPVFLFLILAGLAGYVFAGQFAIYAVSSELDNRLNQIGAENESLTHHLVEVDGVHSGPRMAAPEGKAEAVAEKKTGASIAVSRDGKPVSLPGITTGTLVVPSWVKEHFLGLALDNGKLYMRAEDRESQGGHSVVVVSSMPLNAALLTDATRMLGETTLVPLGSAESKRAKQVDVGNSDVKIQVDGYASTPALSGGHPTKSSGFYDIPVSFAGAIPYTNWQTGDKLTLGMIVTSRPTILYQHLVSYSPAVSNIVRVALIVVAVLFAIIELIAFIMAVRLNRTITGSVSDLYVATQQINRGDLTHRIPVTRNDQLAELSVAFNTMTASLARLLIEQKEKERLQNELSIAQEVQANLFPSSNISLPMLELHGVCKPAQSVSGDYYDFLLFGDDRLGIALGDISGKGISAALLMATLHSAVRAYRIAGEEIISAGNAGLMVPDHLDRLWAENPQLAKDLVQMFDSPSRILLLLNKHLYRSTQMEKYATLFLAHYDGRDQVLTYSNGGQLPPLVLGLDGSIKRMDCGGPVIGLLADVEYEQGKVRLERGDIFVAYSDGVTEPENDFGDFGEERLVEIVQRNKHLPLSEISHHVMQALSAWIGAEEQPDDITLVLARQV